MTIQQREALWIQQHGSEAQAYRAALYIKHPTKTTTAALHVLFVRVCEGRP